MQVPSPANGIIEALLVPDGGKVEGGTPLFTLRKTGGKEVLLWSRSPVFSRASSFTVAHTGILVPLLIER